MLVETQGEVQATVEPSAPAADQAASRPGQSRRRPRPNHTGAEPAEPLVMVETRSE